MSLNVDDDVDIIKYEDSKEADGDREDEDECLISDRKPSISNHASTDC
jgi:hypothetical protein